MTKKSEPSLPVEVRLAKQPQKYLDKVDDATRRKLYKGLEDIASLTGDIVRLQGWKSRYRYKMEHYRITFDWVKGELVIRVIEINTRSNIKY